MGDDEKVHIKKAVALLYDKERDRAPRIVAAGRLVTAEQIVSIANEHNIPMHKNTELVEALLKFEVATEIPPDLYKAVAEVLAFVYKLDERKQKKEK
jgi:flagellar biosynthesis protein